MYLYQESDLWFVVSVTERLETDKYVELTLTIHDILRRAGQSSIGDQFTVRGPKTFFYPLWRIQYLDDGLQEFVNHLRNKEKTHATYPNLDFNNPKDVIRLIKMMYGHLSSDH